MPRQYRVPRGQVLQVYPPLWHLCPLYCGHDRRRRTSADLVAEVQARLAKCDQGLNLDIHGQVTDRRTYKQRGNSHYSNVATLTAV